MDTLQFFYRSRDCPAGSGAGETVENSKDYSKLNDVKNWRQTFSSLWDKESFKYIGKTFKSHEHALQSCKFRINGHFEIADSFTVESGSKLGKGTGLDARKARKTVMLTLKEMENWNNVIGKIKDEIYICKYTQCPTAKKALMLTGNAQLISGGPRLKRIRCTRLEKTRKFLQENFMM